MSDYIIRRLIQGVIVLLLVTIFVFIIIHLLPGDPITLYVAQSEAASMNPEQVEMLRHKYGLDKPVPLQYVDWLSGLARGDLGMSITQKQKVSEIIVRQLPATIHVGVMALILSAIFGVIFGAICALRRGTWIDSIITVLANLGITAPPFWIGILLIYLFGYVLKWLPMYGYTTPYDDFWLSTKQTIMPVFCLSLMATAVLARQTRSSMLEVIRQDYIRTAWSKGLREHVVVLRHALKNAFIPIITLLGVQVRSIIGVIVVIEIVFSIPGIGGLLVDAVLARDYQVVQGGILVVSITVLVVNLLVDISYGWFDPRIRYT